jgi:fructan beta-fructosidase
MKFALSVLAALLCGTANAADEPALSLKDVPEWGGGHYKVDPFIAVAAKFQALGKEKAQKLLLDFANPKKGVSQDDEDHQNGLFILCRMLFTAKPKGEFRRAAIGLAICLSGTSSNDWTLDPIEIVDGVPFLVAKGYLIAGFPEPVMSYVEYCIKNCDWNSFQFKPKTAEEKQKALAKLLALPKLKGLNAEEKEFLASQIERPDLLVADFEGDAYPDGWKTTGTAFGKRPAKGTLAGQMPVTGYLGKGLVNSFNGGDASTGTLTSPAIKIERKYLNFLIGGGKHPGKTCINLLVDGKVVRTATGPNDKPGGSEHLDWQSWDVSEFEGKEAVIEIVDDEKGGWGHINVDQIVQSDKKKQLEPMTREFKIEERYLHLPVKTGAAMKRMKFLVDGKTVREFDIELADGMEPDFWAFADVAAFKDQKLTVEAVLISGSKALDAINANDKVPDFDKLYEEKHRPLFHFTSRRGWLNDPNGLVFADGEWHMFYQHNPFGVNWGNMHWGHAVSDDLVHWKELGEALYPKQYGDFAFSGSAVVDNGNTSGWGTKEKPAMVLAYTSTGRGECIAFSKDRGRTWTEYDKNPVVKHSGRDPKLVWYEKGKHWVMAVYDEFQGKQWIAFHTSSDLKTWTFASRIEGFFECPDLFEMSVGLDEKKMKWILYAADGKYLVGEFDGKEFKPDFKEKKQLWHGRFYAAQTFSDIPWQQPGKGFAPIPLRVQVGWANGVTFPGMPFNQQMTVPVELQLDSEGLSAYPVWQLLSLREKNPAFALPKEGEIKVSKARTLATDLDAYEIDLGFGIHQSDGFTLDLRGTKLVYDAKKSVLTCKDVSMPVKLEDGGLHLHILVDRGSIEVFSSHSAMSVAAIPDEKNRILEVIPNGGEITIGGQGVYRMKSAWKK